MKQLSLAPWKSFMGDENFIGGGVDSGLYCISTFKAKENFNLGISRLLNDFTVQ